MINNTVQNMSIAGEFSPGRSYRLEGTIDVSSSVTGMSFSRLELVPPTGSGYGIQSHLGNVNLSDSILDGSGDQNMVLGRTVAGTQGSLQLSGSTVRNAGTGLEYRSTGTGSQLITGTQFQDLGVGVHVYSNRSVNVGGTTVVAANQMTNVGQGVNIGGSGVAVRRYAFNDGPDVEYFVADVRPNPNLNALTTIYSGTQNPNTWNPGAQLLTTASPPGIYPLD